MKRHFIVKYNINEGMDDMIQLARFMDDHFKIVRTDVSGDFIIYILVDNWFWLRKIATNIRAVWGSIKNIFKKQNNHGESDLA